MNKVIILGRLGKEVDLRYTQNGKAVANFSIATSEKYKDKETTEWHNIVAWDKTAELCNQYLSKGAQVLVEGKIQTRSWDDKDGNKKYTTEIVAMNVQFVGSKKESTISQGHSGGQNFTSDDVPF